MKTVRDIKGNVGHCKRTVVHCKGIVVHCELTVVHCKLTIVHCMGNCIEMDFYCFKPLGFRQMHTHTTHRQNSRVIIIMFKLFRKVNITNNFYVHHNYW